MSNVELPQHARWRRRWFQNLQHRLLLASILVHPTQQTNFRCPARCQHWSTICQIATFTKSYFGAYVIVQEVNANVLNPYGLLMCALVLEIRQPPSAKRSDATSGDAALPT